MKASRVYLFVFLITIPLCLVNTQPVKSQSSGTIYIRADGSVEGTDKIQRDGNVYTLTDSINGSIIVEKDGVTIDGADYILQGTGSGTGISLTSKSNVTIQNTEIKDFGVGVHLIGSSNNIIYGNHITNNGDGVFITDLWLDTYGIGSLNNSIVGNNITLSSGNITLESGCGIKITRWSKQNTISGNIISRNGDGIYVSDFSNNTVIIDNNVTLNERYGIHIDYYSDGNIITGNYIANNGWKGPDTTKPPYLIWCGGIRLYRSINNTLRNNQMVNNMYNFELLYVFVSDFINDIDTSNTVNGKPIYHWIGERDKTVPSNAGYVALINCTGITVQNLNLANNKDGILITSTKDSIITGNNITNCITGIYLDHSSAGVAGMVLGPPSSGIIIYENNIMNNDYGIHLSNARENTICRNNIIINNIGIHFDESEMNEIYHNNFINNTDQVRFNGFWMPPFAPARINTWDHGYPTGGNYWSNYKEKYPNATELNGWVLWNTPYVIAVENKDNYPLMYPLVAPPPPDTTPPTVFIVLPENKTYDVNNVTLVFSVSESTQWVGYSLDGQDIVTITSNMAIIWAPPLSHTPHTQVSLSGLSDGPHSLVVYAMDEAGNTGTSKTVNFSIEVPPTEPQPSEPFPTWVVAAIAMIAIGGVALLVYFRKIRKTTGEVEK